MWWLALAVASATEILVMPVTPSTLESTYMAAKDVKGAGSQSWRSLTRGYQCIGENDRVFIKVERDSWPNLMPKKVVCEGDTASVKFKVVQLSTRPVPMFVSGDVLVMPRERGIAAVYEGKSPRSDLIVQQGRTAKEGIDCKVEAGGTMKIVALPTSEDGDGRCSLRTAEGEIVKIELRVVTLK